MKVYTFTADGPALIPGNILTKPTGPRIAYSDQLVDFTQLEGYWKPGDRIILVSMPAYAGVEYVCVTEGSPGTWIEAANAANGVTNDGYVSYGGGMWPNRIAGNVAGVSKAGIGQYYIGFKRVYADQQSMGIHLTVYKGGGASIPVVPTASGGPQYGWDVYFRNPSTGQLEDPEAWFALLIRTSLPSLVPSIIPA